MDSCWHSLVNNPVLLITTSLRNLVSEFRGDHGKCLRSKFRDAPKKVDSPKPLQLQEHPQKWGNCRSTCVLWIRVARQPQVVTWLYLKCDWFLIRGCSCFWSDFIKLEKLWCIWVFIFCVFYNWHLKTRIPFPPVNCLFKLKSKLSEILFWSWHIV